MENNQKLKWINSHEEFKKQSEHDLSDNPPNINPVNSEQQDLLKEIRVDMNNRPFNVASVRDMLGQFDREEITFSRFVEMLNQESIRWKDKQIEALAPSDEQIEEMYPSNVLSDRLQDINNASQEAAIWMRDHFKKGEQSS